MTTSPQPDPSGLSPATRISSAERESAIARLRASYDEGRLDPAEHERRLTLAQDAVTRGDLDALFTDLPPAATPGQPSYGPPATPAAPASAGTAGVPAPTYGSPDAPTDQGSAAPATNAGAGSWPSWATAASGVTPFVALILFFVTKQWLWFLLVPIVAILLGSVYGSRSREDRARRRNRG